MALPTSARPASGRAGAAAPADGAGRVSRLLAALPAALLLFAVVVAVAMARRWSHEVPTWHMDGAFQTASGLFRLADGQVPGRDSSPTSASRRCWSCTRCSPSSAGT